METVGRYITSIRSQYSSICSCAIPDDLEKLQEITSSFVVSINQLKAYAIALEASAKAYKQDLLLENL